MKSLSLNLENTTYPIHIGDTVLHTVSIDTERDYLLLIDNYFSQAEITKFKRLFPIKHVISLEAGESLKSLTNYHRVIREMLAHDFTKNTTIIAVGGGTVGDFAGFVAATFHRGIPYIQIPTTLLAMVDASIGGKTALNIDTVKNVIGVFHHPSIVYINPSYLKTLPTRHLANGFAEIIKIAIINDKTLFNALNENTLAMDAIIYQALTNKKQIVEADFFDTHKRQLLNFGHTIGHALESYHHFKYYHGECIAVGMKQMVKNTEHETTLTALLEKYNLNITIPYDKEHLYALIKHDKKLRKNQLTLTTIKTIGEGILSTINITDIKKYL